MPCVAVTELKEVAELTTKVNGFRRNQSGKSCKSKSIIN